jgi:unsaturated chondroitin disaccharide hydrolase
MYVQDDGSWYTTEDGNWCAGHWIGLLWLAARHSDDRSTRRRFALAAHRYVELFREQPLDSIFAGMNHLYAGFLGFDVVGDDDLRSLGLRGADAMVELFDPVAEQIPVGQYRVLPDDHAGASRHTTADWDAWDLRHMAAVDAIHTAVPVLWRAHAETGESRYSEIALRHTLRHLDWYLREDGSTIQLRPYDAVTGDPGPGFSPLAGSDDGCWSRGLGWNIAGLAAAYVATGDALVLEALRRSAAFYESRSDANLVPPWDLSSEDAQAPRDASAAAVAAYGLLLLRARPVPDLEELGTRILDGLITSCMTEGGAVEHGCYRYPQRLAIDGELIWTDFYALAARDQLLSTTFG